MNNKKLSLNFTIIATLAVIFGTAMTSTNSVWAAPPIQCPNVLLPVPFGDPTCIGTEESDNMQGNANSEYIKGLGGDDKISGSKGNDEIDGGLGADTIKGGAGDDKIYHNINDPFGDPTLPDGSADKIDCGAGLDTASINRAEGDTAASNCEIVPLSPNP